MIQQTERTPTWARLGTSVAGMNISDALAHSKIDFEVAIAPLVANIPVGIETPDGEQLTSPERVQGRQITYRADNLKPIAPVGARYHVVQTREAIELIEGMTACGWQPEFAGTLNHGGAVFMAGKLAFDTTTHEIDPYLCFINSFDGTSGLKFACTPYRPACTNQVRAIFGRKRDSARPVVSLRHTSQVLKRAETVRELLGLTEAYYKYLDQQIERLCEVTMTSQRINEVLEVVAPLKNVTSDTPAHIIERRQEKRALVTINLDKSPTIENRLRSTAWGMYNSITEIEQWNRTALPTASQSEQMLGNHVGIVPMTTVSDRVYRVMERWLSPA